MKRQIRTYFRYTLKENVLYILMLLLLIIFTIGFVWLAPGIYSANDAKLAQLDADIKDLGLKKSILDSSIGASLDEIDLDVTVMSKLIPEVEDYFSAIAALEELSAKTGFIITGYDVDLSKSGTNKLSLNITGLGDQQSFINFLQQYNFEGGRLITTENISLGRDKSESFNLVLNFYNQKAGSVEGENLDYQHALQTVNKIKSKVTFNLQQTPEQPAVENYEKKSTLF